MKRKHGSTVKKKRERNFWINSPARNTRLLDWLESHPLESHIIYTRTKAKGYVPATDQRYDDEGCLITKKECYDHAAQGIFAADEDIHVRKDLQDYENRRILRNRIRRQVESWRKTYVEINCKILDNNPNQNLGDIQPGTQIYKDTAGYRAEFPFWWRLNALWHGLFCWDAEKPAPKRATKKRRFVSPITPARDSSVVIIDSDSEIEEMKEDSSDEEYREPRRPKFQEGSSHGTRSANPLKRKISEGLSATPMESPTTSVNASQLEEQRLKLEIQKLENDALRIKMKMERQRGAHEERNRLQEALMGLINSLPTENSDAD